MTQELQAFIKFFSNEEQLRNAIEGLLTRMPGITGVVNRHSAGELGKDIIFYAEGALGDNVLHSCVVKRDKITGSASSASSGARNVLIQAEQSLDTPVQDANGVRQRVNHVYVMCPHDIGPSALASIADKLAQKAGQITMCCGHTLYRLFQQHWSDFIFLQPDLMLGYVASLRARVEADTNLERAALAHGLPVTTTAFSARYVKPKFHQVIGEFQNTLDIPSTPEISRPLDRDGSRVLSRRFSALFQAMQSLSLISETDADRRAREIAVSELETITQTLISDWEKAKHDSDKAFFDSRRVYVKGEGPPPEVPLKAALVESIVQSSGYDRLLLTKKSLDDLVASANRMDFTGDEIVVLSRKEYRTYTSALEALAFAPRALKFMEKHRSFEISEHLLESFEGHLMITAPPGFGKTSFCRNNVRLDLEQLERFTADLLPIYIPLHELTVVEIRSIKDTLFRPDIALLLKDRPNIKIRVYLDGLDEIQPKARQMELLAGVGQTLDSSDGKRLQFIVTGRDHVTSIGSEWLTRVRLRPFSDDQLAELASNLLDSDRQVVDQFFSRLLKLPGLFSVVRVPLLGTLTILLFKHLRDLPDSRNKLYSMFIDLLLGGWNLAKGMKRQTEVASNTKLATLTRLAGMMHSAKQKECSANLFLIALKEAGSLKTKEEAVLSELVEDAMLVSTGRDTYMFPHLSFQEFLAARDIAEPSGSMASQCLLAFLQGDDWWREVLYFYIGMTARPKRIEAWIAKHVQHAKEMKGVNIPDIEVRARQLYDQLLLAFPNYSLSLGTAAHRHRD